MSLICLQASIDLFSRKNGTNSSRSSGCRHLHDPDYSHGWGELMSSAGFRYKRRAPLGRIIVTAFDCARQLEWAGRGLRLQTIRAMMFKRW
jgi:hypothetical protein